MIARRDPASPPAARAPRPVPTTRMLAVLAGVAVCAFGAPLLAPLGVVWELGVVGLGFLVLLDLATRPRREALVVERDLAAIYHVGRGAHYTLRLRNDARVRLRVALREVPPAGIESAGLERLLVLRPGEVWSAEVPFCGLRRGGHEIPPLGVGVSSGLGLLEHRGQRRRGDVLRVAPGRPSREIGWLLARTEQLEQAGAVHLRRSGADWEFESLRDYVIGDERRRIDWKASARRHRPMVRQLETERGADLLLALDCGRLMGSLVDGVQKLDLAMTPVLDLAAVALRRGERVGLLAFDSKPRVYLPPRPGMAQLHAMTSAMAGLPDCTDTTSYLAAISYLETRHRKRATLIVFTDFADEITAQEMAVGLASLARRHLVLFVAVADAHIERIFTTPPETEEGLFEKAVAGELRGERLAVLDRIANLGVPVLDAEPHRLSGPLLSRYFEARSGRY